MQLKMAWKDYWNTPFQKICVGMTVNGDTRWMMLEYEASSLYNVIADGEYLSTSAGKFSRSARCKPVSYWLTRQTIPVRQ